MSNKKHKVTKIKNKQEKYNIQNTLLFHTFNRLYVVLVFIGLILKRNMSMKYVLFLPAFLPLTVMLLRGHYKLSRRQSDR